jgi:hypothetical protein
VFCQTELASCSVGGGGVRLHAVIRQATASPKVIKEKERFIGEGVLSISPYFENRLHLVNRSIERVPSFDKSSFRAVSNNQMHDEGTR